MKIDRIKQYMSLREGLEREKAELEGRLHAINDALGVNGSPAKAPERTQQAAPKSGGGRRMSAAARARIAAAQRARWARARGGASVAPKTAAKSKGTRQLSTEQRAKIAEAQRKRWAKYRKQRSKA